LKIPISRESHSEELAPQKSTERSAFGQRKKKEVKNNEIQKRSNQFTVDPVSISKIRE
jgi:hypothetical protein